MPTRVMSPNSKIYDVLILGAGPAGLSTALGLARIKRTALVLSNSRFRNAGVSEMHAVLGYDSQHPAEFRRISREQIERYGKDIEFVEAEAVRVGKSTLEDSYQGFAVEAKDGNVWKGRKMVLGMGSRDIFPKIEGYSENWPENIYQCPFCDGRERSHLPFGALGFPSPAHLNHAAMLCHLSGSKPNVTLFTQGPLPNDPALQEAVKAAKSMGCVFESRKIAKFTRAPDGEIGLDVHLEDGEIKRLSFIFDKPLTEVVGEKMLVEGLGVELASDMLGSFIKKSEPFGETNVKGCFVAGDAGTSLKQATIAVSQGLLAAAGASMQFCAEEGGRALAGVKKVQLGEVEVENVDSTNCVK